MSSLKKTDFAGITFAEIDRLKRELEHPHTDTPPHLVDCSEIIFGFLDEIVRLKNVIGGLVGSGQAESESMVVALTIENRRTQKSYEPGVANNTLIRIGEVGECDGPVIASFRHHRDAVQVCRRMGWVIKTDTAKVSLLALVPNNPPLDCTDEEFKAFVMSLKVGDRVVECGQSMMIGETGTVVEGSREGEKCVRWDTLFVDSPAGRMTTSITGGTRLLPADLHL